MNCTRFKSLLLFTAICLSCGSLPAQSSVGSDRDLLVGAAAQIEPGQSQEPFRRLEALRLSAANSMERKALELTLTQLLHRDTSFLAKRFACQQLGMIGTDASVPALAALLSSEETAGLACLAFTTYPAGKADAALREATLQASTLVKVQLLQTLGDRGDPKALQLFIQAAADDNRRVSAAGISGLGKNGTKIAIEKLRALSKKSAETSRPVLEALLTAAQVAAAHGDARTARRVYADLLQPAQELPVRRAAFEGLLRLDRDGGQARILSQLRSLDQSLKPAAIAAVARLKPGTSSTPFASLLPQLSPEFQAWMIDGISAIADAPALTAATRALGSEYAPVRQAAITAVAKMAGKDSLPSLVIALNSSNSAADQKYIETALVSLPSDQATDLALVRELQQAQGSVRAQLLTVITRRQGAKAKSLLLSESDNASPLVAKTAFRALMKTAEAQDTAVILSKLLRPLAPEVRPEAEATVASLLGRIRQISLRSDAVRDAMARADTPEKQISMLNLMPGCGDAAALDSVKEMLANPDASVATAAIEALAEWPNPNAWDPLAQIYFHPGDQTPRTVALKGLLRLLAEDSARVNGQTLAGYERLLQAARDDADRRQILGTLGGAAHPGALVLAQGQLSVPAVHAEAEAAVRRIAEALKTSYPKEAEAALKTLR